MKTIDQQLAYSKEKKQIGLMTHVVIGYPSLLETKQIILAMAQAGVDFIELQIPFSDPVADGPTIMQANDQALANGVRLKDCFALAKEMAQQIDIPLLFMSYYNPIFHYGTQLFCQTAHNVGIQGLIVPDMPIDEEDYEHFMDSCIQNNLNHIRLLSPSSTAERIKANAKVENGFVYCTSRSGITGANQQLDLGVQRFLNQVRQYVSVPIAVGFGISEPQQVQTLIGHAEIAVVGSAVIEQIQNFGIDQVGPFVRELVEVGL